MPSFVPAILIADDEPASHSIYDLHLEDLILDRRITLLHALNEHDARVLYLDHREDMRIIVIGGFRDGDIISEFREVFRGLRIAGENNPHYRDILVREGAMIPGGKSKGETAVYVGKILKAMIGS